MSGTMETSDLSGQKSVTFFKFERMKFLKNLLCLRVFFR
ncbi:hypothetical protein AALB_2494 [Agarivorans albus MKT 106]|uniref:Uncharacterized protein n=1 Tax=Agarivorans albus MKT 106 TaxID=1331007 RepID=R9PM29_AGAAL|nr:hypothetical protein AALB_2494 [Agarivorans albus MKT 106]